MIRAIRLRTSDLIFIIFAVGVFAAWLSTGPL